LPTVVAADGPRKQVQKKNIPWRLNFALSLSRFAAQPISLRKAESRDAQGSIVRAAGEDLPSPVSKTVACAFCERFRFAGSTSMLADLCHASSFS
jgi:hypothetical protein